VYTCRYFDAGTEGVVFLEVVVFLNLTQWERVSGWVGGRVCERARVSEL
jgi:hypothetical protein